MKKSLVSLLLLALLAVLLAPVAWAQDEPPLPTEAPVGPPPIDPPICLDFCPPPVWKPV